MFQVLLVLHILAGTATLVSASVAITAKLADVAHRVHVISGKVFVAGMTVIFITAVGMSLIRFNSAMLFIAIFSFYFAWMGWRYALNRRGEPNTPDTAVAGIMSIVFVGMIAYGLYGTFGLGEGFGTVVIVFGIIGLINSYGDWQKMRAGGVRGKERIAEHLSHMLGGTIAAVTAFFVVNLPPSIIVWLLPTAVLTPVIVIWSRKIKAGVRRKGMPS